MAATNNSLSLAETATVPAPQQALSSTFEENVLTRTGAHPESFYHFRTKELR